MTCQKCGRELHNSYISYGGINLCQLCYDEHMSKNTNKDMTEDYLDKIGELHTLRKENKALREQNENLKCCENCKYWHTCSFTCDITLCTGWEYDGLKSAEREV